MISEQLILMILENLQKYARNTPPVSVSFITPALYTRAAGV
jgi:hypothetical protein